MHNNLLIFGGGPLQLSIIKNAKEMGLYTIVIDPDNNALGRKIADKFFRVDGNDFEGTVNIAKENNVKGIVTAATDKPLLMMARVAEKLGLQFPSYESVLNTIDKYKFKEILLKNYLACAKGIKYTDDSIPTAESIEYPIIIKPTNNSGSRGVVICKEATQFINAVNEALSESNGEIIIEEFLEGDEISVEALVYENKVHILQITDKITTEPPYSVEIGQIQPSKYKDSHFEIIHQYLQNLVEVLNLNNCALHPEFKINSNEIFLLEMGPRLGGDYITSHLVPLSTGVNMEKALIQIAIGQSPTIEKLYEKAAMVKYFSFNEGLVIKNEVDIERYFRKFSNLKLLESTLLKDQVINKITNSLNRYGHFIISGNNVKDVCNEAQEISIAIQKSVFE